jgi:hypothetical protein
MAVGAKTIETRHWPTNHRGKLAIHAAKRYQRDQRELRECARVSNALANGGIYSIAATMGHIVCIVDLCDVRPTEYLMSAAGGLPATGNNPHEYDFGNYDPKRYGWMTRDVRRLAKPLKVTGRQGLFNAPIIDCDRCDGTGLMEGWNHRDGHPCPHCYGDGIMLGEIPF